MYIDRFQLSSSIIALLIKQRSADIRPSYTKSHDNSCAKVIHIGLTQYINILHCNMVLY